jgi:hypothetical protein
MIWIFNKYDSILVQKGGSGYMNTGFDQNLLKSKSDQINQTFHNIAYDDLYRLQSKDLQPGDNKSTKE